MSRRNREKRAAKQKERRSGAGRGRRSWAPDDRDVRQISAIGAVMAAASCRCEEPAAHAAELAAQFGQRAAGLDAAVRTVALMAVDSAWQVGWTPGDLYELGRRRLPPLEQAFLAAAVVAESQGYAPATLHPRWRAGLAVVAAGLDPAAGTPHPPDWVVAHGLTRPAALALALRVIALLARLPELEQLVPLPGVGRHDGAVADGVDGKALAKVRALLAKAESTEFPEEAEALSAKAQELMSRYALHQAVVDHDRGRAPRAAGRRLWLDAPYAGAKAHLVDAVATANRCRAVWSEKPGFATVVGAEVDLELVELLVTSLLMQANRAMLAAGRQVGRGGTSRTRSFRQSFLLAYATRIGERLQAASAAGVASAGDESRLLPVLAARGRAAEELTERLFPQLVQRAATVSNAAGWAAGHAAAELALFDVQAAVAG